MAPDAFLAAFRHFTANTPYRWWTIELASRQWLLVRHAEEVRVRPDGAIVMTEIHGIEHWFDASSVIRVMAYTEVLFGPDDAGIPF